MASSQDQVAPYTAFSTFQRALDLLESRLPLPRIIERSTWPEFSMATQYEVLRAFKFLKLIEANGDPHPRLYVLVQQPGNRRSTLRSVLEDCYPPAITRPSDDTSYEDLVHVIEQLGVQGATVRKAVGFYLAAAEYAGLLVPSAWQAARRSRRTRTVRTSSASHAWPQGGQPSPDGTAATVRLRSGGHVTLTASVDLFMMSVEDRAWLLDLVDKFREYQATSSTAE